MTRYLAGFGVHALQGVQGGTGGSLVNGAVRFLHGDLTSFTMLLSDEGGIGVSPVGHTAFGDPVVWDEGTQTWLVGFPLGEGGMGVPPLTRYQYDGDWGYESGLASLWGENTDLPPVTLQHVGERWYAPALGRFFQHDPIDLPGGLNVYAYCHGGPVARVDPSGMINDGAGTWNPNTIHNGWGDLFMIVTGGEDSWLDDPVIVDRWSRRSARVAVVCIFAVSGGIAGPWVGLTAGIGGAVLTN